MKQHFKIQFYFLNACNAILDMSFEIFYDDGKKKLQYKVNFKQRKDR